MSDEELMRIAFDAKLTVREILRSIFDIGLQQGRADAIKEYKSALRKQFLNYDEHGCPCLSDIMEIIDDAEIELKEQK